MISPTCRKCGGELSTHTVDYVMSKFCNHCGPQPFPTKIKRPSTSKETRK